MPTQATACPHRQMPGDLAPHGPPSRRPQVPITLNAAFCERHRKVCPPSDELERECSKVSVRLLAAWHRLLPLLPARLIGGLLVIAGRTRGHRESGCGVWTL